MAAASETPETISDLPPEQEGAVIKRMLDAIEDFPPAGTRWFVVSMKWWSKWKQYTMTPDT
jgi:hypothetical protein